MQPVDLEQYKDECVGIDRHNLNDEFCRVSADYAFWADRYSELDGQLIRAKAGLDEAKARADADVRSALFARGEKATETKVEHLVNISSVVMGAVGQLASVTTNRTRVKGILEAIATKRDMLVSLGATIRAERQADPTLFGG